MTYNCYNFHVPHYDFPEFCSQNPFSLPAPQSSLPLLRGFCPGALCMRSVCFLGLSLLFNLSFLFSHLLHSAFLRAQLLKS